MPFPLSDFVRSTIVHHFRRKDLEWTEDYFIRALESGQKHDVYWAAIALRACGTPRCVPALRSVLHFPMQDVKCTALLTIAHVVGPGETPLYAELLSSSEYREKGYAMWAINDSGDERAMDAVLSYFRKNWSRLKRGQLTNGTLPDGIQYLRRVARDSGDIPAFFDQVKAVWSSLGEGEQSEILKRVPDFLAG